MKERCENEGFWCGILESGNGIDWPIFIYILIAGWFATDFWRFAGVLLAGRIREDSEIFIWTRAVANALVAAVIARLIIYPVGAFALIALHFRILAVIAGFAGYWFGGRRIVLGIIAAELVLLGGIFL